MFRRKQSYLTGRSKKFAAGKAEASIEDSRGSRSLQGYSAHSFPAKRMGTLKLGPEACFFREVKATFIPR